MEEFRHSYSRLCKESGAEPQETVLQQLQGLPRGRLDLATQSLTVDTCRALGELLQKETLPTELILSDCMLSEEGGHPRARRGQGSPCKVGVGVKPFASGQPGLALFLTVCCAWSTFLGSLWLRGLPSRPSHFIFVRFLLCAAGS